jgi:hypothetical protein
MSKPKTVNQGDSLVPRNDELGVGQPGAKQGAKPTPVKREPTVQKLGNMLITHN